MVWLSGTKKNRRGSQGQKVHLFNTCKSLCMLQVFTCKMESIPVQRSIIQDYWETGLAKWLKW
jgi:hypothetical protein